MLLLQAKTHTYFFNPVYQSAYGSVYATSGSGFMVNDEAYSEGSVYAQTMDATYTKTENGKTKTDSISIKLSISVMLAPDKIVILQMNANNKLLSQTEYTPGTLPEHLTLEADTEYFIMEAHKRNTKGDVMTTREIYSQDAERIATLFVRKDGICVKHWTQIKPYP